MLPRTNHYEHGHISQQRVQLAGLVDEQLAKLGIRAKSVCATTDLDPRGYITMSIRTTISRPDDVIWFLRLASLAYDHNDTWHERRL